MAERKTVADEWVTVGGPSQDEWVTVTAPADAQRPLSITEQGRSEYAGGPAYRPFADIAIGAAKGAAETAGYGLPGLINRGIRAIPGASRLVPPYPEAPKSLEPQGVGQAVGNVGERFAEFALPGGAIKRGGDVMEAATVSRLSNFPRLARGLALGERAALEGSTTATLTKAQGGSDKQALTAGAIGAATPPAIAALQKGSEALSGGIIHNLIRPQLKQFRFGKNPGRAVAEEGIMASSMDGLVQGIQQRRNGVGRLLDGVLQAAAQRNVGTVDIKPFLKPVDEAIKHYGRNPENQELVSQLINFRKSLTEIHMVNREGQIVGTGIPRPTVFGPYKATLIKREIGESTKWSGESYEKALNQIKAEVYRKIDHAVDALVPETRVLNERYGNLLEAQKAAERRMSANPLSPTMLELAGAAGGAGAAGAAGAIGVPLALRVIAGSTPGATLGAQAVRKVPRLVRPTRNLVLANQPEKWR